MPGGLGTCSPLQIFLTDTLRLHLGVFYDYVYYMHGSLTAYTIIHSSYKDYEIKSVNSYSAYIFSFPFLESYFPLDHRQVEY